MLKIRKSGFYSSIQDQGRFGYRHFGVPVSGSMDLYSAEIANKLLGNDAGCAVLEMTMTGPELEFEAPTFIALAGAEMEATCNGEPISLHKVYKVEKGSRLQFKTMNSGFRTYMAVKGGFLTEEVLGSRSFYKGITPTHYLQDLQHVPYEPCEEYEPLISDMNRDINGDTDHLLVSPGPEYNLLENPQLEKIFSLPFTVSMKNNRMAYQLEETIPGHNYSMITSVTLPGTVQFTPGGKLIVLMRDGQTTGGYPRILQLSDQAVNFLAQKKFNDHIHFRLH